MALTGDIWHGTKVVTHHPVVQRCPVCDGRGQVAKDFYLDDPGWTEPQSDTHAQCRRCSGQGTLYLNGYTALEPTFQVEAQPAWPRPPMR